MKNKELILEAIDNSTGYSLTQKNLLKLLINISSHNLVKASAKELSELYKQVYSTPDNPETASTPTVYKYLTSFSEDATIEFVANPKRKRGFNHFKINPTKLDEIVELFLKKKELITKQTLI